MLKFNTVSEEPIDISIVETPLSKKDLAVIYLGQGEHLLSFYITEWKELKAFVDDAIQEYILIGGGNENLSKC